MNPDLNRLQPYPFEKLAKLKAGCQPPADRAHIALSIGEPKHATPAFIHEALTANLAGLANYPVTRGSEALRNAIAAWLIRRFSLSDRDISADRNILPVNGTREALFSFAQAVVDRSRDALVLMPNPFYQIYEGAAYLAGATPWFMNSTEENQFIPEFDRIPDEVWKRCQLLFICSPGNPTGAVTSTETLQQLIELADRHDFIIASDECYSELYTDEDKPPAGLLGAAQAMGRKALECTRLALGICGGRCEGAGEVSAVSHLSWLCHATPHASGEHGRMAGRGTCTGESGALSPEIQGGSGASFPGPQCFHSCGWFLPVAENATG